jgi:hypothetical protein
MWLGGQCHALATLPPGKDNRYHYYRRLSGSTGRLDGNKQTLPSPGLDSGTARPVASRYTDYAIPAHKEFVGGLKNYSNLKTPSTTLHNSAILRTQGLKRIASQVRKLQHTVVHNASLI